MKKNKIIFFFLSVLFITSACRNIGKKSLADIEKQELATGVRNDSLFQGIYLGMAKRAFFDLCWQKNKEKLFTDGQGMTVEYQLGKRAFFYPIQLNFYPKFQADKIGEMPMKFAYKGIDLTLPRGVSEKLMTDVKKLMEEWYGTGFFATDLPLGLKGYAKVSGNRRVIIFSEKEYEVMVVVTDLAIESH